MTKLPTLELNDNELDVIQGGKVYVGNLDAQPSDQGFNLGMPPSKGFNIGMPPSKRFNIGMPPTIK